MRDRQIWKVSILQQQVGNFGLCARVNGSIGRVCVMQCGRAAAVIVLPDVHGLPGIGLISFFNYSKAPKSAFMKHWKSVRSSMKYFCIYRTDYPFGCHQNRLSSLNQPFGKVPRNVTNIIES
jgi:hypothetical protein